MPDFILPSHNTASPFADMHGHHVAVGAPSLTEAKDFYVGKLDFRVVAEWDYEDEKLAYLAPPADDHLFVEILGGGDTLPTEVRPYADLGDSISAKQSTPQLNGRLARRARGRFPSPHNRGAGSSNKVGKKGVLVNETDPSIDTC